MPDMGIYKITNTANGKIYIGQSVRLSQRLSAHRSTLKNNNHYNQHLQNAYNKYGDVFEMEVLEYCDDEAKLDDLERYYIAYYNSMNPQKGYNKEDGGNLGKHFSDETRKKMSDAQKKAKKGQNHPLYGKHHTEATKKKMSVSLKSNAKRGKEHYLYGKHHTAETKRKISNALKGRKKTYNKTNKTGFYQVFKISYKQSKQGFSWQYRYQNNKKTITSVNLLKLKTKVEALSLPWKCVDEKKAKQSLILNNKYLKEKAQLKEKKINQKKKKSTKRKTKKMKRQTNVKKLYTYPKNY